MLATGFAIFAAKLEFVSVPFSSNPCTAAAVCLLGLFLPWLPVLLLVYLEFDEMTQNQFTSLTTPAVSCATGLNWSLHLFTLIISTVSSSIWAICLCGQVEKSLLESKVPDKVKECFPTLGDLEQSLEKKRWAVQLEKVALGFASSVLDQYSDLCACLVMYSCGYEYVWINYLALVVALLLQHVGGAVLTLLLPSSRVPNKVTFALLCLVAAPPLDLMHQEMKPTAMYMLFARAVFEDIVQIASQLVFTFAVYWNNFVFASMAFSFGMFLLSLKKLLDYRHGCKMSRVESSEEAGLRTTRSESAGLLQ